MMESLPALLQWRENQMLFASYLRRKHLLSMRDKSKVTVNKIKYFAQQEGVCVILKSVLV